MKATGYYSTAPTVFGFLCKDHWNKVYTKYNDEDKGTLDED